MKELIVEDHEYLRDIANLIIDITGYEPEFCANADSAWKLCQENTYPLAILDVVLSGIDGAELCKRIRTLENGDDFYILVFTSYNSHSDIDRILVAGADDYCSKPVDSWRAKTRLMVAQRNIQMRKEQRINEKRIRFLATHDSLTGLANRHAFYEFLDHSLLNAQRYNRYSGVFYIDLDGFKEINDTFGHSAGDEVLKETAKRLRRCLRDSDMVCRLGGDEFALVVTDLIDRNDIRHVQEKIITQLRQPYHLKVKTLNIDGSIGYATFPDDGVNTDDLIHKADFRMYKMKHNHRHNTLIEGQATLI